jgi:hypothetical protein
MTGRVPRSKPRSPPGRTRKQASTQLRAMFVMRVMLHEYSMVRSRVQILFVHLFQGYVSCARWIARMHCDRSWERMNIQSYFLSLSR